MSLQHCSRETLRSCHRAELILVAAATTLARLRTYIFVTGNGGVLCYNRRNDAAQCNPLLNNSQLRERSFVCVSSRFAKAGFLTSQRTSARFRAAFDGVRPCTRRPPSCPWVS